MEEDWLDGLRTLIDVPAIRERLGAAARRTVVEGYSMEHCADRFAQVIRETLEIHSARAERPSKRRSGQGTPLAGRVARRGEAPDTGAIMEERT